MTSHIPTEIRFESDARTDETMSGLLVTLVQKARELRFFETLTEGLNLKMKSYVYSHQNKIETLVASVAVGCRHTSEIQSKLTPDKVAARLFGMERFPDQSQINDFLRACGSEQVEHLAAAHEKLLLRHSRAGDRRLWWTLANGQRVLPVDLDQTPLATRSTKATGTAKGYFGRKRSQLGYKKTVALLGAGVQELLWLRLEAGNVHEQAAVASAIAKLTKLAEAQGIASGEIIWRGDSQYGSSGTIRQFQAAGQHYLLKGYTPKTARHLAESLPATAVWHFRGLDSNGSQLWVTDAGVQELRGHDDPPDLPPVRSRVVLLVRVGWRTRSKRGKGSPNKVRQKTISYEHYLTDLSAEALPMQAVIDGYNDREAEEGFFQTEQDTFGAHYLRTKHKEGEAAFLWLMVSTINLLRWVQHSTFANTALEQVGLTKLVTQVLRIPATIIQTAHLIIVRLPELAWVTRQLVNAYLKQVLQLPLPLSYGGDLP